MFVFISKPQSAKTWSFYHNISHICFFLARTKIYINAATWNSNVLRSSALNTIRWCKFLIEKHFFHYFEHSFYICDMIMNHQCKTSIQYLTCYRFQFKRFRSCWGKPKLVCFSIEKFKFNKKSLNETATKKENHDLHIFVDWIQKFI